MIPKLKANVNKTFIYTDQCKLCGHTEEYRKASNRFTNMGKDVFVKQTPLWVGWQQEANKIGIPMPFAYDYDTGNSATIEELDAMSDEDLRDWLGFRD